jgi:hypothetical protein
MLIKLEHLNVDGFWVDNEIELDLDADMSLGEETIDKDMMSLPRVIAYYADLAAELHAQAARHKQHMDEAEASAAIACRQYASDSGSKITEPGIKEQVILNPEVRDAKIKYSTSEAQYRKLNGFYQALRDKTSLSIAICYKQKEEIRVMNSPLN